MTTHEKEIMENEWRIGRACGAIVCDAPDGIFLAGERECWDYYGGLVVCESCPRVVAEHIIRLHNASLGEVSP